VTDPRLEKVRAGTRRDLSDADVERLIARAERRRRRRIVQRSALALVACLAVAGGLAWRQLGQRHALRFADGSAADLVTPESEVSLSESSPGQMVVQVRHGGARFDVAKRPSRRFRVVAGGVTVEVIGTAFVVERGGGEVRVRVDRGRVRVTSARGVSELGAGESGVFPESAPPAAPVELPAPPEAREPEPATREPAPLPQPPEPPAPARHAARPAHLDPDQLFKAADAARVEGRPTEAAALLERAIKEQPHDPRAQLAGFTLGRVLLEELKRPERAAEAFARARGLAPRGPLAEDALYREAQCWIQAGETRRAIERARLYLRLYPDGTHRRTMERMGAIE
jgi:transmembrane sensor